MYTFKDETGSQHSEHSIARHSVMSGKTTMSVVQYRGHLHTLYETHGENNHDEVAEALNETGLAYLAEKQYVEAQKEFMASLTMYRQLEEDAEENEDKDATIYPALIANVYKNLGMAYLAIPGRIQDARSSFKQSLKLKNQNLKNFDIAELHYNLAITYLSPPYDTNAETDATTAIEHLTYALDIYHVTYQDDDSEYIEIINIHYHLGLAYQQQNNHAQALNKLTEALTLFRTLFEDNDKHPAIATTLYKLGITYQSQRNYAQAISSYNQALAIYKEIHKTSVHLDVAELLHRLGQVYVAQNNLDAAREHLSKAETMYKAIFIDNQQHELIVQTQDLLRSIDAATGQMIPSNLTTNSMFSVPKRDGTLTEKKAQRALKPVMRANTSVTWENLKKAYKQNSKFSMFNASGKIFTEENRDDVDTVVNILRQRAQNNPDPNGAARKTLSDFYISLT